MTNSEITAAARKKLSGNWLLAILAFLIIFIISSSVNFMTRHFYSYPINLPYNIPFTDSHSTTNQVVNIDSGLIFSIFLAGAFSFGAAIFSIYLVRGYKAEIELIFDGFRDLNRFFVFLATNIIIFIFTLAWTLLFIIPGIIAALSYSMTYYILVDNPTISSLDAISQSKQMMKGHKWQLFKLWLRFFILGILCIFTLGIGFLWLIPYTNICTAQFYDSLLEDEEV
ncbi:DUF975 family protein [Aquirufa sp. ROCK-SH2]